MLATREFFFELSRRTGRDGGIPSNNHDYFEQHRDRFWDTIRWFNLLERSCECVLDIGPYFSYTPFLWKEILAKRVCVFEGDSTEAEALRPLYRAKNIEATFGDLFEIFQDPKPDNRRLPYADDSFDFICCFETMEHFNFNPVPFVRELHRVTKPGGFVCITVPNMAKFERRLEFVFGKSIGTPMTDFQNTAGSRYFGLHWREYTLVEITTLFRQNSFAIESATHLQTFKNRPLTPMQSVKRTLLAQPLTILVPGFRNLCAVKARK